MAVLGGILLLVALAIAVFCLWAASATVSPAVSVDMFNNTLSITATTMFLLGALAMLLLLVGIWLAFFATKRRYRSHKERRTLEKREKEQAAELAETRARLGQQGQGRQEQARTGQQPAVPPQERPAEPVREQPVREQSAHEQPVREQPVREQGRVREVRPRPDVQSRPDAPHGNTDYMPPRNDQR